MTDHPIERETHPLLERAMNAMEDADVGYTLSLTKLVDGVSEYTAVIDGLEPRIFGSHSAASKWVAHHRRFVKARALLAELQNLTPDVVEAGRDELVPHKENVATVFTAMINHILKGEE